jgi:malonyl-CoA O-methyltransferase
MPSSSRKYPFEDEYFGYIEAIPTLAWISNLEFFLSEAYRLIKPGGLFGFGSFGMSTLENFMFHLNSRLGLNGRKNLSLIDMHDIGDACISIGFKDPIVLSSILKLQYNNANKALSDIVCFFGNPEKDRFEGMKGKLYREHVINSLENCRQNEGLIELNFELVYGHAWKVKKNLSSNLKIETISKTDKTIEFYKS